MELYARNNDSKTAGRMCLGDSRCCTREDAVVRHRIGQRRRQPQQKAAGFFSRTTVLVMVLFLSVVSSFGNSGKGVALAFSGSNLGRQRRRVREPTRNRWVLSSTTESTDRSGITASNSSSSPPPSLYPAVVTICQNRTQRTTSTMEESKPSVATVANKTVTTNERQSLRDDNDETKQKLAAENHQNHGVPKHVGLICDGNGRWATQKNLPRAAGHLEGARRLVDLVRALVREKRKPNSRSSAVSCITLYAFSTENWNRSPLEITKIFEAIQAAAFAVLTAGDLAGVDVKVLGDLSDARIPESLRNVLVKLEERGETRRRRHHDGRPEENTSDDKFLEVCLAVNYGGRSDIVSACRALAREVEEGTLRASDITEDRLQQNLGTGNRPPPDMIVRTGGEHRLSNFLLWESAYAELFVSPVLWPDFSFEGEWKRSLEWYSTRKRNFGGRGEERDSTER